MGALAVSAGTSRQASLEVGDFKVSEVTFPPNRRLPWHSHPLGCVAVVMDGVVDKRFARFEAGARAGALITMPPKEPHEDRFGGAGAAIVVVESQALIGQVSCTPDAEATLVAMRIRRELAQPDSFTPLAVEGLALELTALAGRSRFLTHGEKWVERARSLLLERFRESVTPGEIATESESTKPTSRECSEPATAKVWGNSLEGCGCSGQPSSWQQPTYHSPCWRSRPASATRATSRARSGGSTE